MPGFIVRRLRPSHRAAVVAAAMVAIPFIG